MGTGQRRTKELVNGEVRSSSKEEGGDGAEEIGEGREERWGCKRKEICWDLIVERE